MLLRTEEDRFVLDVDPDRVREAARKVAAVAREFDDRATRIATEPTRIGSSWTGKAARHTKTEIRGLSGHLVRYVERLGRTREALLDLARRYEEELEAAERLNRRWREADDDYEDALGRAEEAFEERASHDDAPTEPHPLRLALDPTYLSAKADAEAVRRATRARLERRFGDLQAELRSATRSCARRVSQRVPLPMEPALVARYRADGYVDLQRHRPDFADDMPLSWEGAKASEVCEVPESDDEDAPLVDGWDASGGVVTWSAGVSRWYSDALAEAGELASAGKVAKFSRKMPLIGHAITVAGVGHDIRKGESPTRSVALAAGGVAGTAAVVFLAATAPVSVPVALIAVAGVGASVVGAKLVGHALDTETGRAVVNAFDKGANKVASAVSGAAKSAWKSIF